MKRKNWLYIFITATIIVAALTIYFFKEFNRKVKSVEQITTSEKMSVDELLNFFSINEKDANDKYVSKAIEVTGVVSKIEIANNCVIIFKSIDEKLTVRCSMDSGFNCNKTKNIEGSNTTIKGICTGYNADDLGLGADVLMNRCIILEK